jgi:hypothetical protein
MSSKELRTQIKDYLALNSGETVVDISGEFRELIDVATYNSITPDDNWAAIQFIGSDEEPISVEAKCYREFGSIFIHVIAPIQIDVVNANILDRAETMRSLFRGKRINDIVIESVSPLSTESGTTLEFDNSFTSGTFFINYYRDIKGA